jgi:translation initiation factor 2B subunit (eIF-2B alpha/beta/delta family)
VRLIVDALSYRVLPEADPALVGGDSLSVRGLVNKAATALLALGAARAGIPLFSFCSATKYLPAGCEPAAEPLKEPREVLGHNAPNLTVVNYYFDTTPLDLLAGIVTEDGVLTPEQAGARLAGGKVHEILRSLVG